MIEQMDDIAGGWRWSGNVAMTPFGGVLFGHDRDTRSASILQEIRKILVQFYVTVFPT
jgi:hypothetical protein